VVDWSFATHDKRCVGNATGDLHEKCCKMMILADRRTGTVDLFKASVGQPCRERMTAKSQPRQFPCRRINQRGGSKTFDELCRTVAWGCNRLCERGCVREFAGSEYCYPGQTRECAKPLHCLDPSGCNRRPALRHAEHPDSSLIIILLLLSMRINEAQSNCLK